jgi:hypothetical protein
MASNFPKLPGFVPTHDPTLVSHKKISHIKLEQVRNPKNQVVPLHALPRAIEKQFLPDKTDMSKSLSQVQYPNHVGTNEAELYEPTFAKLDKQVSRIILCHFVRFIFCPLFSENSWHLVSVSLFISFWQLTCDTSSVFYPASLRSNYTSKLWHSLPLIWYILV